MPWWTAWLWRQLANGWKTSRPVNRPIQRLPRLVGTNEPWAQSWKTMKVRRRKPEVGIASASTSQGWSPTSRYMTTIRAM